MTILENIVKHKIQEVRAFKKIYAFLNNEQLDFPNSNSLLKRLKNDSNISVIAEIKKGSPSKGYFAKNLSVSDCTEYYSINNAACISVLTDRKFFYGGFDILKQVRSLTPLPILCKDFIIDEIQIKMAKKYGANVILLIKRILTREKLIQLLDCARKHHLEVLVEIDSILEFDSIKDLNFEMCGVNNRNLADFTVSLDKTKQLARHVTQAGKLLISESGIYSEEQIVELIPYNISGVLVGEALIRDQSTDLIQKMQKSKKTVQIKICGIQTITDAIAIDHMNVEYIGLVFAKSKRQITKALGYEICNQIKNAKTVGVFMNQDKKFIEHLYASCHLDYVQLHGDIDIESLNIPKENIIKAIAYTEIEASEYSYILIDGHQPGSGNIYNLDLVKTNINQRYILAGGLTSENVTERLKAFPCSVVDVSSGVETDGKKDLEKVKLFIKKVRGIK
ncbi:MAG: hypothetical protein JEZ08_21155 [Clostridiales bacterium]|nr:hypothetical protein [Clostridiales bacterium]